MIQNLIESEKYALKQLRKYIDLQKRLMQRVLGEVEEYWQTGDYVLGGNERVEYESTVTDSMNVLGINYDNAYPEGLGNKGEAVIALITWLSMTLSEAQYEVARDVFINSAKISVPSNIFESAFNKMDLSNDYERRIINNVTTLSSDIADMVQRDFANGVNVNVVMDKVQKLYSVDEWKARRLVLTEQNYFYNQGEKLRLLSEGEDSYEYVSVLDGRTSNICRELNGRRFLIENAVVGENFPPMHPYCRSTIKSEGERIPERFRVSGVRSSDEYEQMLQNNDELTVEQIVPYVRHNSVRNGLLDNPPVVKIWDGNGSEYNPPNNTITLARNSGVDTLHHEVGHFVDKKMIGDKLRGVTDFDIQEVVLERIRHAGYSSVERADILSETGRLRKLYDTYYSKLSEVYADAYRQYTAGTLSKANKFYEHFENEI